MMIDIPVDQLESEKTAQFLDRQDDVVIDSIAEANEGQEEYFTSELESKNKLQNDKKQSRKRSF